MPFEYDGRHVRGLGVFDMKGGSPSVPALRAIEALGLSMSVVPIVFLNSDEEIGSRESAPHMARLARAADRALILEPSLGPAGALKTARKGEVHDHRQRPGSTRGSRPRAGRERDTGALLRNPEASALNDPAAASP